MPEVKAITPVTFTDQLSSKIEGWFYCAPGGREINDPPWVVESKTFDHVIPSYARERHLPVGPLVAGGLLALLLGLSINAKVLSASGAALLTMIGLAWRRTWLQCGQLKIEHQSRRLKLHEQEELSLSFVVLNTGKTQSESAVLYCRFGGAVESECYLSVPPLKKDERKILTARYKLDKGMGEYRVEALSLVLRDPLGLFWRSVSESTDILVEVVPEEQTMEPLKINVSGRTMHSGVFEAKSSGDSPTFLGLRPFRSGDSIKRIDWKRSQKQRELVVREYERLNSTDATIVVDTRGIGLFEFGAINSFESLKDTVIAIVRSLLDQQIQVRIVTSRFATDMAKGRAHFDLIVELLATMKPDSDESYQVLFGETLEMVQPDSLVVPVFLKAGVSMAGLLELFVSAEFNRIDVIPVIIDTETYESAIVEKANFSPDQVSALEYIKQRHVTGSNSQARDFQILDHLLEKTIIIRAGETISSAYRRGR